MRRGLSAWAGGALIVALYLFLLAPLLIVLIVSFDTRPYLDFPPQSLSLQSYALALKNKSFLSSLLTSLWVAGAATALGLALGLTGALAITRAGDRLKGALTAFYASPMLLPHIVLAVGLMMVLQPVGLLHTVTGLIVAHISITFPYVFRILSAGLLTISGAVEEAARIHGASPWQAFVRVTLPLLRPSLIAAALISFLISFDEAVIALFVAGGKVVTLPLAIYQYVQFKTDPQIAALSVLLILSTLFILAIVERSIGLRRAISDL